MLFCVTSWFQAKRITVGLKNEETGWIWPERWKKRVQRTRAHLELVDGLQGLRAVGQGLLQVLPVGDAELREPREHFPFGFIHLCHVLLKFPSRKHKRFRCQRKLPVFRRPKRSVGDSSRGKVPSCGCGAESGRLKDVFPSFGPYGVIFLIVYSIRSEKFIFFR